MRPPVRFLTPLRRIALGAGVAAAIYVSARFDVVRLPEGALSPLYGIHAGDRLLVDRHARRVGPGETWLFRDGAGALLLGRVEPAPPDLDDAAHAALEAGAAWIVFERSVPGVADSRTLGPIAAQALAGRVVMTLPW